MKQTRKCRRAMQRRQRQVELRSKRELLLKALATSATALALTVSIFATNIQAMPQDGQVTAGTATVAQSGNTMTVTQTSDKLALNWQSFGIGANETVIFAQPSAQSLALNRVIGSDPSAIFGRLSANGNVFLINPNGVLFAPGAQVNVGGLVASTLNVTDADFLAGRYYFAGDDGSAAVINQGTITAAPGGYVVLAGPTVSNEGTISATQGAAALAAGSQIAMDLPGDGTVNLEIDRAALGAAVSNSGVISTPGGQAILTGRSQDAVLSAVVNNSGIVEAQSLRSRNGVIILDAGSTGAVQSSGTLDASGKDAGETGGTVKMLGDRAALNGGAVVDVSGDQGGGTVLIGGNFKGQGPEINATDTYIDKNATIKADALTSGNGGKVAVWSDHYTRFDGTISARGGKSGGDGGFVETSGKKYLGAQGSVIAFAPLGQAGVWLMDPENVTIQKLGADTGVTSGPVFTATSDSAIVTTASIENALNTGTSVTITTGTNGRQAGNISINDNILKNSGSDATLSLSAANNIVVSSGKSISSTQGKLNINFNADSDGITGGTIKLESGSKIATNGGNIDLYGGTTGSATGYASSINADTPGVLLQGATLDTTVASGVGGYLNVRGGNSGDNIHDNTTGHFNGIVLTSTDGKSNLLKTGGGNITMTARGNGYYSGQEALAITDSGAQIIAGGGTITLTADTMSLSGYIGQTGDTGKLNIVPLTKTTNIAIGTDAATAAATAETAAAEYAKDHDIPYIITALKLTGDLFSNVIQPGLTVAIGTPSTSSTAVDGGVGTITVAGAALHNDLTLYAPGLSASPDMKGSILINGAFSNSGTITLNSYLGASTSGSGVITAGGLNLIDPRNAAIYDFRVGSNQVGTLAANTGQLLYNGTGTNATTTIGTIGSTVGITLTSTGSITLNGSGNDLFVSKNVSTAGAQLTLAADGTLTVGGASISTTNGSLSLTGSSLVTTGAASMAAGSGSITLTGDNMSFSPTSSISGSGQLYIAQNTASRSLNIGAGSGSGLNLAGSLFSGGSQVFRDGFSLITIGNVGTGILKVDGAVTFTDPVVLQSPGGTVDLAAGSNLNNSTTNQNITIDAGTFQSESTGSLNAGSGALIIEAGAFNVPGGSISGSGTLEIAPLNPGDAIALGSGSGGLILPTAAFNGNVFKDGFSKITVGDSNGSGAITVGSSGITFTDPTVIQALQGSLTINGALNVTGANSLTLSFSGAAQNSSGIISATYLELDGYNTGLGPVTIYDLTTAPNQIGTVAAMSVNQVLINNAADLSVGTVNGVVGIQTDSLYGNATHTIVASLDKISLQVSAPGGMLTVNNASLHTQGAGNTRGDITLTADQVNFTGTATVQGSGNLFLQPFTSTRNIDIGTYAVNSNDLQLSGFWFNGAVFIDGFNRITIGGGNGSGAITLAGAVNFVDSTTIQSPNTTQAGLITLSGTANVTTGSDSALSLDAKTINGAAGAKIQGGGDVYLTADAMNLGDGTSAGVTVQGTGTLYLRPFNTSTTIDLGAGFTPGVANHLQFDNAVFAGGQKVFSGFGSYTIGGNGTTAIDVTGTANFVGNLALVANTLMLTENARLDPTGAVRLQANTMNFGDYATVTGSGSLQLESYSSSVGMVVGDTSGYSPATNLLIPNGYFNGDGRTGTAKVFTGSYTDSVTFGSTDSTKNVIMKNASFPANISNIYVKAVADGLVDITGTISVDKNIEIWGGTITTAPGATLTSANGDITLSGHTLNLNGGPRSITGHKNLYLQPYNAGDSIGVGADNGGALNLARTLFYVPGISDSGALNNTFTKITIGRSDGYGTINIGNITLGTDLDVVASNANRTTGKIHLDGYLTDDGHTIEFKTDGGATQTAAGIITANNLVLLGGSSGTTKVNYDLSGAANQVNTLAGNAGNIIFHNGSDLIIGAVGTTNGITATYAHNVDTGEITSYGDIFISSDAGLNITQQVKSDSGYNNVIVGGNNSAIGLQAKGILSTNGAAAVISNTGSKTITLVADTMTLDSTSKVQSNGGTLNIQTLSAGKNIGIGAESGPDLQLRGSWFSGTPAFQNGFAMMNIGAADGGNTVTVNGTVTFNNPVTIQAPASGGKIILGSGEIIGKIDNSTTNKPVTLIADTIVTQANSVVNGGSGLMTLIGNVLDFSNGGSITGSGILDLKALNPASRIALGADGLGGLEIDSTDFNNVAGTTFNQVMIGGNDWTNPIVVNDFSSRNNLVLQATGGGVVTVLGTLNMNGKTLSVNASGKIDGSAGTLANVGTLNATSGSDAVDFSKHTDTTVDGVTTTTFANTITNLGNISAYKGISIGSDNHASLNTDNSNPAHSGLTISGLISGNTGNDTSSGVLIRTNGNLTIGSNGRVTTANGLTSAGHYGDIYLSAEGTYAHFFNNSSFGSSALLAGSGHWLVYSHSPLADNAIPNNPPYSSPGATNTINFYGGLANDYKYYGYTYGNHNPESVHAPSYNRLGTKGFLYGYAPFLDLVTAGRTYGEGNQTIIYTYTGLIAGDDENQAMLADIARSISTSAYISIPEAEDSPAGTYSGEDAIRATAQIVTDTGYIVAQGTTVDLTINKRVITVTADPVGKVYDGTANAPTDWNSGTSYTVTGGDGWYGSDTAATVISGNLTIDQSYVNAGTYLNAIVQGTLVGDNNYTIVVTPGTYTIYKRPITLNSGSIIADDKVYDGSTTAGIVLGTVTFSGVIETDQVSLSGLPANGVFADKNAGTDKTVYVSGLNISGDDAANYSLSNSIYTATADITPATLTYTANAASRIYGDPNATNFNSGTITGWRGSDNQGNATSGTLTWTTEATQASDVGTYNINGGGLTANHGNYVFVQAAGNGSALTINPATLTYTANAANRIYGDDNPSLSGTITGWKNSDNLSNSTDNGVITWTTTAVNTSNVGQYNITGSGLTVTNSNYVTTIAQAVGNNTALTINPATLTYTANAANRIYGDPNATNFNSGTITGWKNSETQETATSGTITWTTAATQTSNIGTYNINGGGLTANHGNYVFVQAAGNGSALTINPATLTYTANAANRIYGDPNATNFNSGTITGWKNSDNQGNATSGTLTWTTEATQTSNIGTYNINGGGLTANHGNYVFVQAAGNGSALTINPATLTYTANAANRIYGDDNPSLSGTITGWKNSDNQGNATSGTITWTTAATQTSDVGNYNINGGGLTANHGNYVFVQAAGNGSALIVTARPLTIIAGDASKIYGDPNPSVIEFTASNGVSGSGTGLVNGDSVASVTNTVNALLTTDVGTATITPSMAQFSTGLSSNYTINYQPGTLTITPATLIYLADPVERNVGMANPIFAGTVIGFKNNDTLESVTNNAFTFTTTADSASPIGYYAINGSGLIIYSGNYYSSPVQAPGNATALHVKGLPQPANDSVGNAQNNPTGNPPSNDNPNGPSINLPSGGGNDTGALTGEGGQLNPFSFTTDAAGVLTLTVGQENGDGNGLTGLGPHREETSLPVFYSDGGSVTPEGLYNLNYTGSEIKVIPTSQNVPRPPESDLTGGVSTTFQVTLSDGTTETFRLTAANGVLTIEPGDDAARNTVSSGDKAANKMILAVSILTAVQDLNQMPDQITAVFIRKN